MAMLGKEVRMSRLVNPESKKMMAITVDHAISRGIAPMKGLQPIQETIEKIVMGRPDAMTMTKGIAEHCMWPFCRKGGPFDEGIKLFPGIAYQGHYIRGQWMRRCGWERMRFPWEP